MQRTQTAGMDQGEREAEPTRLRLIRHWLDALKSEILATRKGSLIFDFCDDHVTAKITHIYHTDR